MTTSGEITCPRCGRRSPAWYAACEGCGARLSLASADVSSKLDAIPHKTQNSSPTRLSVWAHIFCGWPLILVAIGGAIGGALGGTAYAINLAIYKRRIPGILKLVINVIVGVLAFGIWLMVVAAIRG